MTKDKAKKLWRRLFGIQPGTLVQFTREHRREAPTIYIWQRYPSGFPSEDLIQIPSEKYVGEIVRTVSWDRDRYLVRWIADRRIPPDIRYLKWHRYMFNIIE